MTFEAKLSSKLASRQAKVGVVGLGYVGLPLAVEFAKAGFTVTGIDVSQSKVDEVNRGESYIQDIPTSTLRPFVEAGKIRATTDFGVISELDTVDICVPTDQHEEVVLAALRAGKHVLVEKPLALTFDVADALVREAEYRNRILMAGQVLRFFPAYRSMAAMLTNAEPVRSAFFRRRCGAPGWSEWLLDSSRSGGGVFDLLVHDADYCISLWGMPVSVRATGYQDLARGIDVIHAELNYPDVGPVIITGGWYHSPSYPFSMEFTIATDRRTLEFSSGGSDLIEYVAGGQETKHRLAEADPFTAELAYFADCVTHQRQPDFCPPQQSAQAVALMHFLLESREADGREITCAI